MKLKKTLSGVANPTLSEKKTLKKTLKRADPIENTFNEEEAENEPSTKRKDIRDIIDYTRPFTIMYSGVEDKNNFDVLYDVGIRNFLMSYHYIQNKHLDTKVYADKGVKFFIDSGAYTYMSDLEYQNRQPEEWEDHIQRYLNWARKHKDMIFAIANLDLENLYGEDVVRDWNERYFEPFMLETEIPVCFIWHPISGEKGWERYCQRYPYVGMSWVSDEGADLDFSYGKNMLATAEKYNTVVHGMGMTRTSLLTKLSFYTSDSTTWLVGLQYGEINFWNGQKMQRLKKDKWKGSYLDIICQKYGLDATLLEVEDTAEMIKANIGAFIDAEAYIQSQAAARFYWQKPKKKVRESIDEVEFPTLEWCQGETNFEDAQKYAEELNINKDLGNDTVTFVIDTTIFTHKDVNEKYREVWEKSYDSALIKELHDTWVNRIVGSEEEMIEDLVDFYTDVVLGKNDKLLHYGTTFDRIVKEREDKEYITDEEYDYVNVPDEEVQELFDKYLPKKAEKDDDENADEVDELDDEIFEMNGIVPVRDEHGKFLKGQRKVLKPKKLASKKFPKLACDTCFNAQKCPEFKAGYVCAYLKMFDRYDTRDMADIIQSMQGIADYSMQRLQRGIITETLEGGLPNPDVTAMMNQTMQLMGQLHKMYEYGSQEVLQQTKVIRADGTQEFTTKVSNPQSGGILEKIFGGMGSTSEEEEPKEEVIEAQVTAVNNEEEN